MLVLFKAHYSTSLIANESSVGRKPFELRLLQLKLRLLREDPADDGGTSSSAFYPGVPGTISVSDPPDPVPLPGALPLFVTGLAGLGLLRSRRKQNSITYDL